MRPAVDPEFQVWMLKDVHWQTEGSWSLTALFKKALDNFLCVPHINGWVIFPPKVYLFLSQLLCEDI